MGAVAAAVSRGEVDLGAAAEDTLEAWVQHGGMP
jgi:hypothetical protein